MLFLLEGCDANKSYAICILLVSNLKSALLFQGFGRCSGW